LFKIATQRVSMWHFHVYMYYNPNWFISSIFLLSTLVSFLWWFQQFLKFYIHSCTESTSTIFTFLKVYIPHIRENMWFLAFWARLTLLKMMFSSSIHLLANDKISFYLVAEWNSIVYKHHIFLIHSSVVGHLGCFHSLAIVNSAAMDAGAFVVTWLTFLQV
jgi:hypothetical protein